MNIFNNIVTPEEFQRRRDLEGAKRRGLSLEEYKEVRRKEIEEKCRREQEEYLKRLGISEEEFIRREKKLERKRMWRERFQGFAMLSVVLLCITAFFALAFSKDLHELVKPAVLILGSIWLIGSFLFVCTPVYLIARGIVDNAKTNSIVKTTIAVLISTIIIGGCVYMCGQISNYHRGIYEPTIKMRPDKL